MLFPHSSHFVRYRGLLCVICFAIFFISSQLLPLPCFPPVSHVAFFLKAKAARGSCAAPAKKYWSCVLGWRRAFLSALRHLYYNTASRDKLRQIATNPAIFRHFATFNVFLPYPSWLRNSGRNLSVKIGLFVVYIVDNHKVNIAFQMLRECCQSALSVHQHLSSVSSCVSPFKTVTSLLS